MLIYLYMFLNFKRKRHNRNEIIYIDMYLNHFKCVQDD